MKSEPKPILIVAFIAIAMLLFAGWRSLNEPPETIAWRKTLAEAQKESQQTGKPILAYFTASWCPPCQKMKSNTWPDAKVKTALEGWVPVKIDVDANQDLAREFNVTSIPRIQVIDRKGEGGAARIGYISADDLIHWLQGAKSESTMGG